MPARGTGNRLFIDEAVARARQTIAWQFEVARTSTALELVEKGFGGALVPEPAIASEKVKFLPIIDPQMVRSIGILRGSGRTEPKQVSELLNLMKSIYSSH